MHKLGNVIIVLIIMLVISITPKNALAGCKSDCRDEYTSEIESCKLLYDDPDDADMLRSCIDDARDVYESCIEECDS